MKTLVMGAALTALASQSVWAQKTELHKSGISYCYRSEGVLRCTQKKPNDIPEASIRKITYSFMETKWVPPIYKCGIGRLAKYTQAPAIGCIVVGFDESP